MFASRPNQARIAGLISDLADAKQDLWLATSGDHAAAARADISTIQHSLWLAGHSSEEAA